MLHPISSVRLVNLHERHILTNERICELVTCAQAGDQKARTCLVEQFMPLAKNIALKYRKMLNDDSFLIDDCIQEAFIGLDAAIMKYDITSLMKLPRYAQFHIKSRVRGYICRIV